MPVTPDDEIVCDVSAGYICARDACGVMWHDDVKWYTISEDALLAWQDGMLIEYDMHTFSPLGAFKRKFPESSAVSHAITVSWPLSTFAILCIGTQYLEGLRTLHATLRMSVCS